MLAHERTRALLRASARSGARVAADALARRGETSLAAAVRAFADDDRVPAPHPPGTLPGHDEIAELLATRAERRRARTASAEPPWRVSGRAPATSGGARSTGSPPARREPAITYPTGAVELRLALADAGQLERHPEVRALTVEVSGTSARDYVLSIEWADVASRFFFELDDLPTRWARVEHEGHAFPLELRRTPAGRAGVRFLEPDDDVRDDRAARRPEGRVPGERIERRLRNALDSVHADRLSVIRSTRA